jgi:capsid protein
MGRQRVSLNEFSVSAWHASEHAQYQSAQDSRLKRRRQTPSQGAPGDYHLRGNDYLKIMEYARAMDRDDAILPSILDRAEINTVQDGFGLDFDTGDIGLDEELLGGWKEWAGNEDLCDVSGEMKFSDMESLAYRQSNVDGDIWALLLDSQQIQWFEADRLRTPSGMENRNIIQGVELDNERKLINVWLTKAVVGTQAYNFSQSDMNMVPIRDDDGLRRFLQIYAGPKRLTMTRGMSVYQRLFELATMHDDTQFAALLKQQLQNAVVFTEKLKEGDYAPPTRLGDDEEDDKVVDADGITTTEVQGMGPAVAVTTRNGRELVPSRNTAPGPDYDRHIRMILTILGVNLGMPLVLSLMDAKETNFSGWRGAFDQAKMGFIRNQNRLISRLHDPVLRWHLSDRQEKSTRLAAMMLRVVDKAKAAGRQWYKWHRPSFPYVNPMEDAGASLILVANGLEAPSTNMAKNGQDHDREVTRGIDDRLYAMNKAAKAAEAFNTANPKAKPQASWQDFYTPLAPKHVTLSMSEMRTVDEPPDPTSPAGGKTSGA